MINFDSLTLKVFERENRDFFVGAKIQKIKQFSRSELLFQLHKSGETRNFYVDINPSFFHLCFVSKENILKRNLKSPKSALMFCMLLRKYMEGNRIVDVRAVEYERIFEIYFDCSFDDGNKNRYCLSIELMGKYSNVILYNYDTNVITGCCHNVGSEKSKDRELVGLLPYTYPKKQQKHDLLKTNFGEFSKILSKNEKLSEEFYYLTEPIVANVRSVSADIKELYDNLVSVVKCENVCPGIAPDFSFFSLFKTANVAVFDSVSDMIDEYFTFHRKDKLISTSKTKILNHINQQIKKFKDLKAAQEKLAFDFKEAEKFKLKADLLMANMYSVSNAGNIVRLTSQNGEEIEISFDTTMSVSENANRYYNLYKKSKSASEKSKELLGDTISKLEYWEMEKQKTENTENIEEIETLILKIKPEQQKKENKSSKIPDIVEFNGFKIFVGKNDRQNDYLLSKISSSEDLWFHTLYAKGAHVLIKKNNQNEKIPQEVILKAARLTKQYSSSKNATKIPIIYTARKYVKKANNKIAFVTYKNETEIMV